MLKYDVYYICIYLYMLFFFFLNNHVTPYYIQVRCLSLLSVAPQTNEINLEQPHISTN